jgi:hypothetical protein
MYNVDLVEGGSLDPNKKTNSSLFVTNGRYDKISLFIIQFTSHNVNS